jgi:hypothetical protein
MVHALMWGGVRTVNHHGSHRRLIWPVDEPARSARVDAIIVPTARPVASLQQAAAAARRLQCPLVTLHSRRSSAGKAVRFLDPRTDLIAIDVHGSVSLRLPELKTSRLLADTIFERQTDVSIKRNLALLLCHMLRWKHVVFLDDDIRVPDPADLSRAASLLGTHTAVGLGIGGFPDNSTVCHAFREAGGSQDTFIGAGALAVEVRRNRTFFPNVYNEDWFFVLDARKGLQSVATVGRVVQAPYDPYRVDRARAEEFGDVLAEGAFWLLDQGSFDSSRDLAYWEDFLVKRKRFIEQVLGMVERSPRIERARRARMAEALVASLERLKLISPGLCVDYLKALANDQQRWQSHIQAMRQQKNLSPKTAIESLTYGSETLTHHVRNATSLQRRQTPPALRPVQAGELESSIASAPPALESRAVIAARWAWPLRLRRVAPASSHAAHALVAADVALACQEGQAEGDEHSDERPSQQLHP